MTSAPTRMLRRADVEAAILAGCGNRRQVAVFLNADPEQLASLMYAMELQGHLTYVAGCCNGWHNNSCEVSVPCES